MLNLGIQNNYIAKFIISTILLFATISCSKYDTNNDKPISINQDKIIPFNLAGRIHNQALGFIAENLKYSNNDNYESLENKAKLLVLDYAKHKNILIDNDYIENGYILRPSIFRNENVNVKMLKIYAKQKIDLLEQKKIIKKEEAQIIDEIFSLLEKISDKEINVNPIIEIDKIFNQFESKKFDVKKGEGIIAGYCLGIARSSVRIWVDFLQKDKPKNMEINFIQSQSIERVRSHEDQGINYDFIPIDPNDPDSPIVIYDPSNPQISVMVAPWVAADVAGAIGGATGSILDNVFHKKPIDWASAGAWAIGGAVAGSTLGPIGKLLTKYFH
jgi:hypothetical protein